MKNKGLIIVLIIIGVIVLGLVGITLLTNSKTIKLNTTTDIKEDNIKLTVLGSEKVTVEKPAYMINDEVVFEAEKNDYIKVKVSIENYGSETYAWSGTTFDLGGEIISLLAMTEEDYLESSVAPGETITGYLYFDVIDSSLLTYTTHMEVTSASSVNVSKYIFRIK